MENGHEAWMPLHFFGIILPITLSKYFEVLILLLFFGVDLLCNMVLQAPTTILVVCALSTEVVCTRRARIEGDFLFVVDGAKLPSKAMRKIDSGLHRLE